jgi:hypothetical protein
VPSQTGLTTTIELKIMQDKKQNNFKTPDLSKMQEVIIDDRTKIYIAMGANAEEAKGRYRSRQEAKGKMFATSKKPVVAQ